MENARKRNAGRDPRLYGERARLYYTFTRLNINLAERNVCIVRDRSIGNFRVSFTCPRLAPRTQQTPGSRLAMSARESSIPFRNHRPRILVIDAHCRSINYAAADARSH